MPSSLSSASSHSHHHLRLAKSTSTHIRPSASLIFISFPSSALVAHWLTVTLSSLPDADDSEDLRREVRERSYCFHKIQVYVCLEYSSRGIKGDQEKKKGKRRTEINKRSFELQ